MVIPDRPAITAPAGGATGIKMQTQFTATNPGSGPLTWLWTTGSLGIGVTAMDGTVTMPDISEYGLTFPASASLSLTVFATGGERAELGARAFGDYISYIILAGGMSAPGFAADGSLTVSDSLSYTTAP